MLRWIWRFCRLCLRYYCWDRSDGCLAMSADDCGSSGKTTLPHVWYSLQVKRELKSCCAVVCCLLAHCDVDLSLELLLQEVQGPPGVLLNRVAGTADLLMLAEFTSYFRTASDPQSAGTGRASRGMSQWPQITGLNPVPWWRTKTPRATFKTKALNLNKQFSWLFSRRG